MFTILIIGAVISFFACWTIGANDAANAMGTSVGSGALTFKRAVIIGGIFEFLGAVLVGAKVTGTVSNGIIDSTVLAIEPTHIMLAMLAALLTTGLFLLAASIWGIPVSTTHAIVGSMAGVGVALGGFAVLQWAVLGKIAISWVLSPFIGALFAYLIMRFIKKQIIYRDDADHRMYLFTPYLVAMVAFVLFLSIVFKGLKNLSLDFTFGQASIVAAVIAIVIGAIVYAGLNFKRKDKPKEGKAGINVLRTFGYLQILTAAYVAFAHGANDVANGIGPLAAMVNVYQNGEIAEKVGVPFWVLLIGGAGIFIGLGMYGKNVMKTLGKGITEITPMRGFAAEFAAATTVLFASQLGMPISTTHTIVGSIIGVGLARKEKEALHGKMLRKTFITWIVQIPIVAVVAATLFATLKFFFV